MDCGAYGGSGRFPGAEAEEAFHRERLGEAERLIQSNYPNLEVVPVYMNWEQIKPLDAAAAGPA